MSAPTSSTVNGASSAPAPSSSSTSASKDSGISSTDVGWQFVPQYYNFVNKHPQRLHCFYTKQSTFIHGTEGEDGVHSSGQQDIHQKILSIGFKDCKVFIHSVDSQPSANGGIIIQVIGEMFNDEGPWRKFVQTFFLAEQPNGYFVLNDIFRFLKEDTITEDEDTAAEETAAPTSAEAPKAEVAAPSAAPAAEEQKEEVAPTAPEPTPAPAPMEEKPAPAAVEEKKEAPTPVAESPIEEKTNDPTPEIESSLPVVEPTPAPAADEEKPATPAPAAPAPAPTPPAPKAAPAPPPAPSAPAAPPAPKTWASLAKSSAGGWGNHLAASAQGVSSAAASAAAAAKDAIIPAALKPTGPKEGGANGRAAGGLHPAAEAANNVTTAQCFVKLANWAVDRETALDAELLKSVLEARFGKVKELEIVKQKACAFLEFATVDSARKAILASLPVQAGGEGGVKIEDQGRITVEVRKEKSERGNAPGGAGRPPRPERTESAGGAPRGGGAGRGRGGGEGGRGGRGGARGGRGGAGAPQAPAAK